MKRISICIPSYNASKYIGKTIQSILDSTYPNFEIIVHDDASTDNTREIVESFSDERIHFYQNKRNLGVPKNWNLAFKKADGDFVGMLNHDDLCGPFWLAFAAHTLEKHPHIGWVATAFRIIDETEQTLSVRTRFYRTRECSRKEAFLCIAQLNGLGPAYIARRKVLEEVGYYDEDIGPSADNDLFLRLAARHPLYYSNNPHHAAWRLHSDNLTHQWGPIEQTTEGLKTLGKVFYDDTLSKELRQHKKSCYLYFYHKALTVARQLIEKGNIETAQHMIDLLHLNGYQAN